MNDIHVEAEERRQGYLSPEFIQQREAYYTDRTGRIVFAGCSDERDPTDESAAALDDTAPENALSILEGYASIFGGLAGVAKNVIITGIVQYGPEFIDKVGGFQGAIDTAARYGKVRSGDQPVTLFALHSAANNENNAASFDPDAENGHGCAYAAGVGATSALLTDRSRSLVRDTARQNQIDVFGTDAYFDKLIDAHAILLEQGTQGKGGDFALDRNDYIDADAPIMILAGKPHVSALKSGVISNFNLGKVRNSRAANNDGKDFYSLDIAEMTAATLEAFQDYALDPELLMRAYQIDSTPVRAVLVANDPDPELRGQLDPRHLPMGFYGDPSMALEALRAQM